MKNFKQLLSVLAIGVLILTATSCSEDDTPRCEQVTGRSILFAGVDSVYYLKILGNEIAVSKEVYLANPVGSTYCY